MAKQSPQQSGVRKRPPADKMSDICRETLKAIDRERTLRLPMPRSCETVALFRRCEKNTVTGCYEHWPAAVVAHQMPGVIKVAAMGDHNIGVVDAKYAHHPDTLRSGNDGPMWRWCFPAVLDDEEWQPFKERPESFDYHNKQLARKEQRCLADEERRQLEEAERQERLKKAAEQREPSQQPA